MAKFFPKHKYGAKRTVKDSLKFPSKLEAKCYSVLKKLQETGRVRFFLRQIPFDLPGGFKHFVDFQVFTDEHVYFVESKGRDLAPGKQKRLQTEELFDIEIKVVTDEKQLYSIFK